MNFIGRKDTQTKVRGQRIELGEIEYQVGCFWKGTIGIAEVVRAANRPESQVVVLFLCFDEVDGFGSSPNGDLLSPVSTTLREMLKDLETFFMKVLPVYMVPSMFVPIENIPRSVAGKTDRLTLRRLASNFTEHQSLLYSLADQEKQVPTTSMEILLQRLWAEVLNKDPSTIGSADNFFRLGGDSILAIRLVALAEARGISFDVASIFRNPALSDMARLAGSVSLETSTMAIEPFALIDHSEELLQIVSQQCDVPVESIQDIYPSTTLQEGLVALSIKSPGAYVIQNVFSIPDSMDVQKLQQAWQTVIDSFPVLKTRIIHTEDLGSLQVVVNERPLWEDLVCMDLGSYLDKTKAAGIQYGGPLTRFAIVEQGAQGLRHFVWTVHHAIYDGWCLPLILEAVDMAFQGLPLNLPSPFSLFIKYLGEMDRSSSEAFWKSALDGTSPRLFPALPSPSYKPRADRQINHKVKMRGNQRSDGTTQSNLIRTAWALVLAKYTGAKESVFGVTLTGRTAQVPGITTMVGPTITTVPIRIRWNRSTTISALLAQVQKDTTDMIPHEQLGLQNIRRLSPDAATACSFQTLLVIQPAQTDMSGTNILGLQRVDIEATELDTYGMTVECALKFDCVQIHAQYDSRLVTESQMQRILYQVEHVLGQLEGRLDRKIDSIEVISPQDIDQVLKWNRESPAEVIEECVHRIFEERVLRQPYAPAIRAWDADLTYRELDRLATQLSHHLVSLGVGPEVMVPFCFEKSTWAVVSMLAILKAGGACVALDPSHPIERLKGIVQDVDATIILTSTQNAAMIGGLVDSLVTVDQSLFFELPVIPKPACSTVKHANPAFVVFTSGSTGKPKGIVLEHKAIATSLNAHGKALKFGPHSRVLQFASYTFDISIQDIFTTLTRGGCVCIISDYDRLNDLAGGINTLGANWACLTPTVANIITPSQVPGLKTLTLAGEASQEKNIETWHGKVDLKNCYGPAECSIYCCWNETVTGTGNIGRPLGSQLWLVDLENHDQLMPVGCTGEICVSGELLARCYVKDQQKTSSSFVKNTAWSSILLGEEHRIYKTGDVSSNYSHLLYSLI